jgi:ABC-type transport system involved in multi-copper enzyme maturation permease subunit
MTMLGALLRLELARARRDRFLWMALGLQALMALVARQGAASLAGSRGLDGPAYAVFSMNLGGTLSTPLLSAIFASGLLAGEVGRGTIRPLLAWPVSRTVVLSAKVIMALIAALVLSAVHLAATTGVALGLPLEAFPDPVDPLRTVAGVWTELGAAALVGVLPLLATVLFATAVSAACNQAATAIGVTVGLLLVAEPVKLLLPDEWERWIFTSHFDTATAIASSRMDQIPASWTSQEMVALVVSSLGALAVGWMLAQWIFVRRAVTP